MSSEPSGSSGRPTSVPRPGLTAGTAVVLAFLAPALPEGVPRIAAFLVLAVILAVVPLALRRQTRGVRATATDRAAQRTRSGILTGTLVGLVVGATSLSFVPLVRDVLGGSTDVPSTGVAEAGGAVTGTDAGDLQEVSGVQALWEETVAMVEETDPGGSTRLDGVRLDLPQVWVDWVTESGTLMSLYRGSDNGWQDPSPGAAESLRDTFSATDVTADLDDVVSRALDAGAVTAPGLRAGQVSLGKAVDTDSDRSLVVDSPGAERVIGADNPGDVTVTVEAGPDADNDGDYAFEATGDGVLAQTTAAPDDLAAAHRAGLGVLSAAGVDPATAGLEAFDVSVDSAGDQGRVDIMVITPDARRYYLDWVPGKFARIRDGEYPGPVPELRYPDLDTAGLQRAVDDARDRGRLVDWERGVIDLGLDVTAQDGPEVAVQISDDPAARGVYALDGTWLRDVD